MELAKAIYCFGKTLKTFYSSERKEEKTINYIESPLKSTPPSLGKFILHVTGTRNVFISKKELTYALNYSK